MLGISSWFDQTWTFVILVLFAPFKMVLSEKNIESGTILPFSKQYPWGTIHFLTSLCYFFYFYFSSFFFMIEGLSSGFLLKTALWFLSSYLYPFCSFARLDSLITVSLLSSETLLLKICNFLFFSLIFNSFSSLDFNSLFFCRVKF